MKLGIVGLPNVGKSTLFNAITRKGAQAANYPFCTIEPNVGMVQVPDERLLFLRDLYNPEKVTPATVEFVDIAGLVRGASKGEGLGNKFLSHIREVDAIVHVVRCFDGGDIIHVEGSVDPARDAETINLELVIADMEMAERRQDRVRKLMKGDRAYAAEDDMLTRLLEHFSAGRPARSFPFGEGEREMAGEIALLTLKPVIYAANLSEGDFAGGFEQSPHYRSLAAVAAAEGAELLPICAQLEQDIAELSDEEKALFLADLGLRESGLDRLITVCYRLLGLISFLTAGQPEVRAWTITGGTRAPQAAGKIHSDIQRGFIRAEIVAFDVLRECGSMQAVKDKGLLRSEGKEYVMQDGDVVLFRFNV